MAKLRAELEDADCDLSSFKLLRDSDFSELEAEIERLKEAASSNAGLVKKLAEFERGMLNVVQKSDRMESALAAEREKGQRLTEDWKNAEAGAMVL